jgi:ribonuclease HI
MKKNQKYYVVWQGNHPGIYASWDACLAEVKGVEQAKYKAFSSLEEAEEAYRKGWEAYLPVGHSCTREPIAFHTRREKPDEEAIAVDAACSGNPGKLEYRGVLLRSGKELFHEGPFEEGTNNIGEFLAIVHALALQDQQRTHYPIYSDSANALLWVKKKHCNTKLIPVPANTYLLN